MAQELSPELVNAVMQAESRGQRYGKDGQLLTSPKGAKGEMQVMDKTNLDPGFGVAPARDASPDERARVGRDYLAAMVNRYPDQSTALMAYNWGPGSVDRWLSSGADPARIPGETRAYVSKINEMMGQSPAPVTQAGPSAEPAMPAKPSVADRTAAYGPSYQAALAVSMLGDSDEEVDKDPDEPTLAEKFLAEPTARSVFADMNLSYASPFEEPAPAQAPAPVQMAEGGPVDKDAQFRE